MINVAVKDNEGMKEMVILDSKGHILRREEVGDAPAAKDEHTDEV